MLHNERLLKENDALFEEIEKLTRPLGVWILEDDRRTRLFNVTFDSKGKPHTKVDFSLTWTGLNPKVLNTCTFKYDSSHKSFKELREDIMQRIRNFVNRETVNQNHASLWWESKE